MKKIVYIICAPLLFISCSGNQNFKEEIAAVDSLQAVVKNLIVKMDSVDFTKMEKTSAESQELYAYITENYKDSTHRDFWVNDMNDLRAVMKTMKRHKDQTIETRENLKYTKEQLATLENSLKDEKLDETQAEQYLQEEKAAVRQLETQVYRSQPMVMTALYKWDNIQSDLQIVADSLKGLE